jgi:hypothetical protein
MPRLGASYSEYKCVSVETLVVATMKSIVFDLNIPREEWLKIYRGEATDVYTVSRDGRRVRFPAAILHKYVTHFGVTGVYEITFDDLGKFQTIVKLD